MRALGYVSRLEGHSFRRQQDNIRSRFASTYRITWFSDKGSTDALPRPGLGRLVTTALKTNSRIIVTGTLRTFGHDDAIQSVILGLLEGYGFTVQTVEVRQRSGDQLRGAIASTVMSVCDALRQYGCLVKN